MAHNAPPWRGRRPRHAAIGLAVLLGALHGAAGAVSPLHSSLRKPGELVYDAFSCGGERRGVERRACRERDAWNRSHNCRLSALRVVRLKLATRSKTEGGAGFRERALSVQHAWSPRRRKRAWHASPHACLEAQYRRILLAQFLGHRRRDCLAACGIRHRRRWTCGAAVQTLFPLQTPLRTSRGKPPSRWMN